ncbi:MAG: hypothetical protein ACLQVN_25720 [Bryobacteraceae bacterium]
MRRLFEHRLVWGVACAFFAMALALNASTGAAKVPGSIRLAVNAGPTLPPDPWDSLTVNAGPTLPPDPWDSLAVNAGPTLPPDPWDSLAVA